MKGKRKDIILDCWVKRKNLLICVMSRVLNISGVIGKHVYYPIGPDDIKVRIIIKTGRGEMKGKRKKVW